MMWAAGLTRVQWQPSDNRSQRRVQSRAHSSHIDQPRRFHDHFSWMCTAQYVRYGGFTAAEREERNCLRS